jgi:hypothetical protein
LDCSEFGGKRVGNGIIHRPTSQRDSLWLTEAESQSLLPGDRGQGETYAVATPIRLRIFLCYLFNWFAQSGGGAWQPQYLRSGDLTLTVEENSAQRVRLRLQGNAVFRAEIPPDQVKKIGIVPAESGQKDFPDPVVWSYEPRIDGYLEYDKAAKKFTRFDAVALGDYVGKWYVALKQTPVPLGIAFKLDPRELAPEYRHAPWALSALKAAYWDPAKWDGRRIW